MTSEDPMQRVSKSRSTIEEIAMMIPGFQGYLKADHRREADRLQREYLCKRLEAARATATDVAVTWVDDNRYANMERNGKVIDILQRVTGKIRNADQGYSGFFGTVQVTEAALAVLYEVDKHMLAYVKEIEKACSGLDPDKDDSAGKQALLNIKKAALELETAFARRKETISGVI